MADFSPQDAQVDVLLTDVAIDYLNRSDRFVAEQILPTHTVPKTSGIYYKFSKDELIYEDTTHADGAPANEAMFGLSQSTYSVGDFGLKGKVTRGMRREMGAELAEKSATLRVMQGLMISREKALATSMETTSVLTQNTTLSGTTQFSDYDNSNPFNVINTGKNAVQLGAGFAPNTLLMSYQVFNSLANHPDLVGRVNGLKDAVTVEQLKSIFAVDNVIISTARYNSARQGATTSMANIWGKHVWLLYIDPEAPKNREYITLGHTFRTEGEDAATMVSKWEDADWSKHTTWVAAEMHYAHTFMAVECAYLIKDAIA